MTLEEKLYSMRMIDLAEIALEKYGIKIDKKSAKEKAVNKILAVVSSLEEKTEEPEKMEIPVVVAEEIQETAEKAEISEIPEKAVPVPEITEEKKSRKKREMSADAVALHEYILNTCEALGGAVFVPKTNINFRGLKCGKSMFVKYSWNKSGVVLQVRATALGLEEPKNPANHTYNDRYKFSVDTPEIRAEIFDIMKKAYDWQLCRNLAKENK